MRTRALFAGGLLLALLAAAVAGAASARTDPDVDTAGASRIDLATYNAKRWIVQLEGKPLARYPSVKRGITFAGMSRPAKIDLEAAVNRRYLSRLGRVQSGFAARLRRAIRGVRVERSYRLTLNALAVRMNKVQAAKVRRMKGVRAVTPDIPYRPLMYATPAQIGAPALWDQLGGQTNAGRGIKVAIIDSGVYVTKDAAGNYAGNPCFNDAGYTMPPGYPKGDTRFTNEKVIVARAYFRPDDPPVAGDDTPIPGPEGSSHGTHVGGTVACNAGTSAVSQGATVTLSGVAPAAYLMNYRIFYPSTSPDPFQNGNGYVAEIVQAIEDAVRDGADVLSNSWGSSHQNTLDWPDPMVEAAEAAVDAGVVGVWAQGNSGPATATGNLPSASPKVISVGAVSKGETISPGTLDVTTAGAPANLRGMDVGPAGYGPQITTTFGPAPYAPASGGTNLACAPLPAGSLAGKIAVVQRGVCEFSTKSLNAQNAGAMATLIYNSAANGDNLQPAGAGVDAPHVTTPTWFLRRSDGLNMLAFAAANPGAEAQFTYGPHVARNIGDVVAGFSSRGPTQDKLVKPDVVAPGVDVLSGGYATAPFPGVFTGFGPQNGTSMATPHVAGAAALLLHRHPWWTPAMVKSALMTTASENVFLNTGLTARAGVLDRGAGRIDLSQAADPGLVVDHPSLSGRQMSPGQVKTFAVRARNISEADDTWDVSTTETGTAATTANFNLTVDDPTLEVERFDRERLAVTVEAVNTASPGNYEGSVVLVSRATGKRLHIPVWLQVVPAVQKDVLLIDDDGSPGAGPDHRSTYTALLDALGLSYDIFGFETAFPSAVALHRYRSIIVFTGENASFDTSGFFAADHDALAEYLDSGGRLWAIGRNWALTEDSGSFHSRLDRGRLTSGYLGLAFETDSVYGANPTPQPTATGLGPFAGMTVGISHGSIDAYTPSPNTDTYNAPHTMSPFFRQIGGSAPAGSAISFGRSSEPSLEEERLEYLYRSLSMGFGLEGLASGPTPAQLGDRAMDWLLDSVSVDVRASTSRKKKKRVSFTATPVSSVGASFTQYRWDFGDGSGFVTTTGPTVTHTYRNRRKHEVRVEVTDSLGHRAIGSTVVPVKRGDRDDDDD
jgi:minor extracellular serine protease Vpr